MESLKIYLPGQSAQTYDPALLAKMKADTFNRNPGELTGHDCHKCNNKGAIAYFRNDGSLFTRACDCMRIRRCVWEMEKSGLQKSIRELTFEAFQANSPWQQQMKKVAMEYAQDAKGWLLFCGQSGSGKTHLCTAVCRQRLYAGSEVRYMSWRDQVNHIKSFATEGQIRNSIIDDYKAAGILYIDDLYKGAEKPTSADVGIAFEIINYRYINRLCTIISTERTPQELVAIDEATGSRILEMAGSNLLNIVKDQSRNYRLRAVVSV